MCFGGSKEPSHRDGSFEYPQYMFWFRNKKTNIQLSALIWGPETIQQIFSAASEKIRAHYIVYLS